MVSALQVPSAATLRRIHRIQAITIAWMTVEATASLSAAWMARSPALLAFGGDSAIELLSAVVVLWSFRLHGAQERAENRAARIAGILLFALAAYVVVASAMTLMDDSTCLRTPNEAIRHREVRTRPSTLSVARQTLRGLALMMNDRSAHSPTGQLGSATVPT